MPHPPHDVDPRAPRGAPYLTDPGTDPDGERRYDALYRESTADAPWRGRAVRQYEPSLRPPENAGEDPFGWLFRDSADSAGPPVGPDPAPVRSAVPTPPAVPEWAEPGQDPPTGRHLHRVIIFLLALLLAVLTGAGFGTFVVARQHRTLPGGAAPSVATPGVPTVPYGGSVTALAPVGADADCQSPPATDDGGLPVDYGSQELYDGQTSTGWRCDGSAVGRSVTFIFGSTARIGEVGLLDGYPKVDPTSGVERYGEYRRVTAVTWTFPGGGSFHQVLTDGVQTVQTVRIPVQQASQVRMAIDSTTTPGSTTGSGSGVQHDAVVVAEATFGAVR